MHTIKKYKCHSFSCTINSRIKSFQVTENVILQIIKSLDPNKARGWNNLLIKIIQPQMVCGESITFPTKIICETLLRKVNFQAHGRKQIWSHFTRRR